MRRVRGATRAGVSRRLTDDASAKGARPVTDTAHAHAQVDLILPGPCHVQPPTRSTVSRGPVAVIAC
jgi:hypothetical protein